MTAEQPTNFWKEISLDWDRAKGYRAENKAGASLLLGEAPDGSPRIGPMEMLLVGLATCTAIDIIDILRKKRQIPVDFKVKVRGNQRADVYPKLFTEFEVEYLLWGVGLKEKDVEQAVRLSEEKYCSVGGTLAKAGPIRSTYRILKPGEESG